jgi:large subunit ribosomal protein L15
LAAEIAASVAAERHGPIPLRIRKPFPVNQDWDVLDVFYANLFGFKEYVERGYLTKELAWQAVTYKSFNHGVDAYNEKLAHLGTNTHTPFSLSVLSVTI